MKRLLLLLLLTYCKLAIYAQDKEIIELSPGVTTIDGLREQLYTYPSFVYGVVQFENGGRGRSRLNYCVLTNEMLFISGLDTLALQNEPPINYISIASDTFYFSGTQVLKLRKNYAGLKIASVTSIKEVARKRKGGYGETLSGVQINMTSIVMYKLFVELNPSDMIVLQKETKYFVSDSSNNFLPLTKENLLQLLPPDKKAKAKSYFKTHPAHLNKLAEADAFLSYLQTEGAPF